MSVIKSALRMAAAAALAATISTAASAAVYPPQRQLPPQVISDFKASPNSLLQQYPGGPQLISRVRDLGASDPSTLPGIIDILKGLEATKSQGSAADQARAGEQIRAVLAGLAQVARLAASSDQAYATEIATAIAGTQNADLIASYQAATGDVAILSTGGGGGGGSGSGGSTGTSGFANGGSNGGASSFGGLHYTTSGSSIGSGSVSGTTASTSPRR